MGNRPLFEGYLRKKYDEVGKEIYPYVVRAIVFTV